MMQFLGAAFGVFLCLMVGSLAVAVVKAIGDTMRKFDKKYKFLWLILLPILVLSLSANSYARGRSLGPVVRIEASISGSQTNREGHFTGSGFIISADGYIITNNHVINAGYENERFDVSSLRVCFDPKKPFSPNKKSGTVRKAKLVAFDADADIAILKIDHPKPLPVLLFGSSADMEVDDSVEICGYPLGGRFKQTKGEIIRLLQPSAECPTGILVCNAKAVSGNSGGPVFDNEGKVIGVVVAMVNVKWQRAKKEIADHGTKTLDNMMATTRKKAKEGGMSDELLQDILGVLEEGKQEIDEITEEMTRSWIWQEAQKHPDLSYIIAGDDVKKLLDKWNINIDGRK